MRQHGKVISFAQPFGNTPEAARLLHLKVALFLYKVVEVELDKVLEKQAEDAKPGV